MDTKGKLDLHLGRHAPQPRQWVRRMGILPHPRVHPTTESVEDSPEGLLKAIVNDRDDEASSKAKADARSSENAPPEGLLEELLSADKEAASNTKVASGVRENDWIVSRRYDSSSEDEESPGRPITITALVHAEACFTDSED